MIGTGAARTGIANATRLETKPKARLNFIVYGDVTFKQCCKISNGYCSSPTDDSVMVMKRIPLPLLILLATFFAAPEVRIDYRVLGRTMKGVAAG